MIDPQLLREQPDLVKASQERRGDPVSYVDEALEAERARRAAITEFERQRAEQNAHGKLVGAAAKEDRPALIEQGKALAAGVKEAQARVTEAEAAFDAAVSRLGNLVHPDVPAGEEANFVTLSTHGEERAFDFEARDHVELGESLQAFDIVRGAKVAGSRFYYLTGIGMRLELAIMLMGLDQVLADGFTPLTTPTLVRPEIMRGTGFLGEHADEVYHLPADDLYLTGTSEVALAGFHADEIVDLEQPKRYAGWSTCYRREAGSAGRDTRGILRVHQFNKLEMFSYVKPDEAEAEHDRMRALQERMLQACELDYRVIDVAAGDLGSSAARKFDIEAWIPSQQQYRELTSTSNCTTFQARRLGTRYRTETGRTAPAATLNGTAATTRWLVAILETHQQADGSVRVPAALQPYLGGMDVIEPVGASA
ncbi:MULTISPECIES: serine--tRNA ligase [unclassified Agrococcus]|uniref:serine--tRNA ligase n=1 Tax=unclassified Agrococcus TaxID=2615065 RepID=UPI001FF0E2BA|nr:MULTISPECIES: serine--tRNA ligase [unclassified Agrococcus]MDR7235315.1 seryl-tRNA synthetase [Agrococcus sp. BE272]UOW01413.1 serine--tRNA ligase [Agrococcus sp. SCSIO52902]